MPLPTAQTLPLLFEMLALYDVEEEHAMLQEALDSGLELAQLMSDSLNNIAGRVLDHLALTLPNKHFMPVMTRMSMEWVNDSDPKHRVAGITAIGICSEGCVDAYADFLPALLDLVARLSGEDDVAVKEAALWTLSQLCEYIQPVINYHHDAVIPIFVSALAHPSAYVLERACHGLECYLDGMSPHIMAHYQEALFVPLGAILVREDMPNMLREVTVSAIASAISASDKRLTPLAIPLMSTLLPLAALNDAKLLRLRACALEAITYTCVCVGTEAFAPFLDAAMSALADSLQYGHLELKEKVFLGYSVMAEALGEGFAAYLPDLMPTLQATVEAETSVVLTGAHADMGLERMADQLGGGGGGEEEEEGGGESGSATDDAAAQEEEDEAHNYGPGVRHRVHTGELEVRLAAARCISLAVKYAPVACKEYLDDLDDLFTQLCSFFAPEMEVIAVQVRTNIILAKLTLDPPIPAASPTLPCTVSAEVQSDLDFAITHMVMILSQATARITVSAACVFLRVICERLGLAAVQYHHLAIMDKLIDIGRERAPCQTTRDDGDGGANPLMYDDADGEDGEAVGEDEEAVEAMRRAMAGEGEGEGDEDDADVSEDHDLELMDEATDTVVAVLAAMGDAGAKVYLGKVLRAWKHFTQPSRTSADRLMGVGMWADLINRLPQAMEPHLPSLLPVIIRELNSDSPESNRNAVYAIGMMVEKCPAFCRPYADSLFATLAPLMAKRRGRSADNEVLDNLASALCRICIGMPDKTPLDTVIPHIISLMPLQADMVENAMVWGSVLDMLVAGNPTALACTGQVIAALGACIVDESMLSERDRTLVVGPRLRTWHATASAPVQEAMTAAVAALSEEARAAIAHVMAG